MKKKFLMMLTTLALCASLFAGCGAKEPVADAQQEEESEQLEEESESESEEEELGIEGAWEFTWDLGDMISEQMEGIDFSHSLEVKIVMNLEKDGTAKLSLDEQTLVASFEDWVKEFGKYMVEFMYQQAEEGGMDREAFQTYVLDQQGVSVEEYVAQLVEQSFDREMIFGEFEGANSEGTYVVEDELLTITVVNDDEEEVSTYKYELDKDTLSITPTDTSESDLFGNTVGYPLTFTRVK